MKIKLFFLLLNLLLSFSLLSTTSVTDTATEVRHEYSAKLNSVKESDNLLTFISMLGIAATAKSLLACKITTIDTVGAGASGLAYLGGEVYAWASYKEIEAQIIKFERGEDGRVVDSDRQALEKQKENYENIRDIMETKRMLQLAAAVGFGASAAMAYYSAYDVYSKKKACEIAHKKAVTACMTAGVAKSDEAACGAALTSTALPAQAALSAAEKKCDGSSSKDCKKTVDAAIKKASTTNKTVCPSALCDDISVKICDKYHSALEKSLSVCAEEDMINKVSNPIGLNTNQQKMFLFEEIFFKEAQALNNVVGFFGMGAIAVGVYKGMATDHASKMDRLVAKPLGRGTAFSAFALLAYQAATSSDDVINALDYNIKRIEKILNTTKIYGKAKVVGAKTSTYVLPLDVDPFDTDDNFVSVPAPSKQYEEAQKISPVFEANLNTNTPSATTAAKLVTSLGDTISTKKSLDGEDLTKASNLVRSARDVDKELGKIKRKFNGMLLKDRKKFNFDGAKAKATNNFKHSLAKSLKKAGYSSSQAKDIFKGTPQAKIAMLNTKGKTKIVPNDVAIKPQTSDTKKKENFASYYDASSVNMEQGVANTLAKNLKTVKVPSNYRGKNVDVSTDKHISIWKVISRRYIQSAYPRFGDLLER